MHELMPSAPKQEMQAAGPAAQLIAQAATDAAQSAALNTLQPEGARRPSALADEVRRVTAAVWGGSLMRLLLLGERR